MILIAKIAGIAKIDNFEKLSFPDQRYLR